MGVFDYSTTAGSNASVGGVAVTEGMARASVNNAMRAQLADLAKLLLDQGGGVQTTGSANAYLVSLNSAPTAYANNMPFAATFNHAVVGASTMNVNSIGVKDLKKIVGGSAVALASGDGPIDHIGIFTYSSANNAVILLNPALISGAYVPGGTDVAIADGGTGQSTAFDGYKALSPMTSRGDLVRGGVTGPERVALGSSGQLFTSDGTDAAWATLTGIITSMFAANVVDTDTTLAADSDTRLASQRATKALIEASAAGISWAAGGAVACATTANITLSGEQTLDGVLTSASRVLVKNQTAATANGIYVSAAGAWARATDADAGAEFVRLGVFISGGTTQAGTTFVCTRTTAPTLGVDNINFVQNGASAVYTAGTGLGLTGNQFNITDAELLTWAGIAPSANVQSLVNAATFAAFRALLTLDTGDTPTFGGTTLAAAGIRNWTGRSKISSPADSQILLTNNAGDNFDRLQFGGTTSSFPMWKRSGTSLKAMLADGSADTDVTVVDSAYSAAWDGVFQVPTKNALYDKIETLAPSASPTLTTPTINGAIAGSQTTIGTWTPVITFVTPGNLNVVYSVQRGDYIKQEFNDGNLIHLTATITTTTFTHTTASGNARITGFPFTSANINANTFWIGRIFDTDPGGEFAVVRLGNNSAIGSPFGAGGTVHSATTLLTGGNFAFHLNLTYIAA